MYFVLLHTRVVLYTQEQKREVVRNTHVYMFKAQTEKMESALIAIATRKPCSGRYIIVIVA